MIRLRVDDYRGVFYGLVDMMTERCEPMVLYISMDDRNGDIVITDGICDELSIGYTFLEDVYVDMQDGGDRKTYANKVYNDIKAAIWKFRREKYFFMTQSDITITYGKKYILDEAFCCSYPKKINKGEGRWSTTHVKLYYRSVVDYHYRQDRHVGCRPYFIPDYILNEISKITKNEVA